MSEQIITYETDSSCVSLFCRDKNGTHSTKKIKLPAKWIWDNGFGKPTCKMPRKFSKKYTEGIALYAGKKCGEFVEYTFPDNTPKSHDCGWYNNKLDRYHAFCVENSVPPSGKHGAPAKVPLMCFDIEAEPGINMQFPVASKNRVLQISAVLDTDMFSASNKCACHIFALNSLTSPLPQLDEFDPKETQTHCYNSEENLLLGFCEFVQKSNPDVISGWNINGFDFGYIHDRFLELFQETPKLGKQNKPLRSYKKKNGVRAFDLYGRVIVDLLDVWRKDHVERSYKLMDVAQKYLDASKAPVGYSEIRDLQTSEHGRSKMATYCVKDSWLVWKLSKSRKKWTNALEMSNVTFVPLKHVFTRGQQWKVYSLLTHYGLQRSPKVFVPSDPPTSNSNYEGAVVVSPKPGFYSHCVSTVDFASLYPTIMIAFNMCYTNRRIDVSAIEISRSMNVPLKAAQSIKQFVGVQESLVKAIPADATLYHRCGNADFHKHTPGLLPQILTTLLKNRKKAKAELQSATSDLERNVANGKQLALKLCANSLYGFTGTSMKLGMLPCPDIASSVTYMGRKLIVSTKAKCEQKFNVTGIYGDTDSVFFHHPGESSVTSASKLALEMAAYMNKMFPAPIELEFEKVYKPFLLLKKKRYVGNKFDEGVGPPSIDAKGVEMVRRDNFPLLPKTMEKCVKSLMEDDVEGALKHVQTVFRYVRTEKILDLKLFTISKELTKPADQYSAKPPHVVVACRIPHDTHERVQYCVTNSLGNVSEKAKHPTEMKNLEIDRVWYTNQLQTALHRLLVHCSTPENLKKTFCAGMDNEIFASGQAPILRALGTQHGKTYRKRKLITSEQAQQKKQMTLNQFF